MEIKKQDTIIDQSGDGKIFDISKNINNLVQLIGSERDDKTDPKDTYFSDAGKYVYQLKKGNLNYCS